MSFAAAQVGWDLIYVCMPGLCERLHEKWPERSIDLFFFLLHKIKCYNQKYSTGVSFCESMLEQACNNKSGYVMLPFRIRVCGPRRPHCHRRDRAPRSSSVHWSCSQETRAAETQSQAQGKSAPLNLSHPHKPTHSFWPLISRETMWARGRKRWHWLWSGVILFSDWAAISVSLKGGKKSTFFCITHSVLTQTAGPVS